MLVLHALKASEGGAHLQRAALQSEVQIGDVKTNARNTHLSKTRHKKSRSVFSSSRGSRSVADPKVVVGVVE